MEVHFSPTKLAEEQNQQKTKNQEENLGKRKIKNKIKATVIPKFNSIQFNSVYFRQH